MPANFCQTIPDAPPERCRQASRPDGDGVGQRRPTPRPHLQQTLRDRWPEAVRPLAERNHRFFPTGLNELDRIFSSGQGLPCGQLIEITGGASSGKTSLLFRLMEGSNPAINGGPPGERRVTPPPAFGGPGARPDATFTCRQESKPDGLQAASVPAPRPGGACELTPASVRGGRRRIAYVDFGNAFFPDDTCGIDLSRLLVIRPHLQTVRGGRPRPPRKNPTINGGPPREDPTINGGPPEKTSHDPLTSGLRDAELLLRDRRVEIVVFDLVGCRTPLPLGLIHRLRLKTVRARGLTVFLTENSSANTIIPSSMASLRLEVERADRPDRYRITVTKSRLCAEGIRLEVAL